MIVGILCLICSLFATAQKPVAPRGSFSKPGLIARANLQSKNASALFAASPKAFHSASFSDEDGEKCEEECGNGREQDDCMFEKCPQYAYCSDPKDRECDTCSIWEGEWKTKCEVYGCYKYIYQYCQSLYDPSEYDKIHQCSEDYNAKCEATKKECTKKCYDDVDADDLRSWQKKCANRCASQFDSPALVRTCVGECSSYSDCPKDSQSDCEDDCKKKEKNRCERSKDNWTEEEYNSCIKQIDWFCENMADVLCPKVQAWVIILIVVLVVVIAACVAVGIFLFLKFRKGGDQSKSDRQ